MATSIKKQRKRRKSIKLCLELSKNFSTCVTCILENSLAIKSRTQLHTESYSVLNPSVIFSIQFRCFFIDIQLMLIFGAYCLLAALPLFEDGDQ